MFRTNQLGSITKEQLSDHLTDAEKQKIVDFFDKHDGMTATPIVETSQSDEEHTSRSRSRALISKEEYALLKECEWKVWYEKYKKRVLWKKTIRTRILMRDEYSCRRCGGRATQVHHRSYGYEVMVGVADDHLASICEGCHNFIHFADDLNLIRRSSEECDQRLLERCEDVDFPAPKIDLRVSGGIRHPADWSRMSARKKSAFFTEAIQLLNIRRQHAKSKHKDKSR